MLSRLFTILGRAQDPERGASAVEYGLMVGLIAVVAIIAVSVLGTNLSTMFVKVATTV